MFFQMGADAAAIRARAAGTASHRSAVPPIGLATTSAVPDGRLGPDLPLLAEALDAEPASRPRFRGRRHDSSQHSLGLPRPSRLGAAATGARACGLLRADALRLAVRAGRAPRCGSRGRAGRPPAHVGPRVPRRRLPTARRESRLERASRRRRLCTGKGGKNEASPGGDAWTAARAAATGEKAPNVAATRWVDYSSYVNCGDDAFRRAAGDAASYVERFGRTAAETRRWRAAQDSVFANCAGDTPVFPEPLPASAPAPLRADRAYQLASARFYAGRLEDAQRGFDEIASDASSPWREIAPYLAARAVLRRATLDAGEKTAYLRFLTDARARFRAVHDGTKSPELRRWSADLLNLVELRLVPTRASPPPRRRSSRRGTTRSLRSLSSTTATSCSGCSAGGRTRGATSRIRRTTSRAGSWRSRTLRRADWSGRLPASRARTRPRGRWPCSRRSTPHIRAPRRSWRRRVRSPRGARAGSRSRTTSRASRPRRAAQPRRGASWTETSRPPAPLVYPPKTCSSS